MLIRKGQPNFIFPKMLKPQILALYLAISTAISMSFAQKWDYTMGVEELNKELIQDDSDSPNNLLYYFTKNRDQLKDLDENDYVNYLKFVQSKMEEGKKGEEKLLFLLAEEFQKRGKYLDAYPLLYKLGNKIKGREEEFPFLFNYYGVLGVSYYNFQRFPKAIEAFEKALRIDSIGGDRKIHIYNTMGLVYKRQYELKEAENSFTTAYKLAEEYKKEEWKGVISGNLGVLYMMQGKNELAQKRIQFDYEYSVKTHQYASAIKALTLLIKIQLDKGDLTGVEKKLQEVEFMLEEDSSIGSRLSYLEVLTLYYEKSNRYEHALETFRVYKKLEDSLEKERDLFHMENIEFQYEFDNKQIQLRILEQEKRSDQIQFILLIFIILTVSIVTLYFVQKLSNKRKREKELLRLKNSKMEKELERTRGELFTVIQNLMLKNDSVRELTEELEKVASKKTAEENVENEKLTEKLQSFTLLTEENWIEFKRLFEKLHPGFFDYFLNKHEDITNAEIRLAALIKLDMEIVEMAKTLGISPDSVRRTNLRLRRKLGIDDQKELQQLIRSVS